MEPVLPKDYEIWEACNTFTQSSNVYKIKNSDNSKT